MDFLQIGLAILVFWWVPLLLLAYFGSQKEKQETGTSFELNDPAEYANKLRSVVYEEVFEIKDDILKTRAFKALMNTKEVSEILKIQEGVNQVINEQKGKSA